MYHYRVTYHISGFGHDGYCSGSENEPRTGTMTIDLSIAISPVDIKKRDFKVLCSGCPPTGSGYCSGENGLTFRCSTYKVIESNDDESTPFTTFRNATDKFVDRINWISQCD